jgi:monoamine oxidase
MSNPDVVVAGAGYAGLAAALDLQDAGLSVVVLEADQRVGGRAWSSRLGNGALAELGGEWIFDGYEELGALAARFGLELVPTGVDFSRREPMGGAASLEDQAAYLESATDALARLGPEERDGHSLASFLDGLGGDAGAATAARARLRGTCAVPLDQVAVAAAEDLLRPEGAGPTWRLADGAQSLAEALAGRLADVRLGRVVIGLEQARSGARVRFQGPSADARHPWPRDPPDTLEAAAAVIALPLPIVRVLPIEPPLPADVGRALDALRMGTAAKLVFALGDEPGLATRQSLEGPFWWWTALGEGGRPRRCVTSFAATPTTQTEFSDGGVRTWVERLLALDPSIRPEHEVRAVPWGSARLAGGAYSAIPPGAPRLLGALERPFGRVVLAGEHTAGIRWHGTLEGALRSGRRAAAAVRSMLGAD